MFLESVHSNCVKFNSAQHYKKQSAVPHIFRQHIAYCRLISVPVGAVDLILKDEGIVHSKVAKN